MMGKNEYKASSTSPPLTIYRASAGAGKTFRLVVEYIKLLVLRPDEYRHILAVTFTKKATQEMKIRILSQLYGLREGLSSSESYMEKIASETNIPRHEVSKNAGKALELILNDYTHFRIETIDSFFQRVLRNMTRELDISSNMRVELNGEQVKDKAIDEMVETLRPTDHVFKRIVSFAEENMEEGKTWNIIGSLKKFGSNIFSDFYQSHAVEYNRLQEENKNLFRDYGASLRRLRKEAEESIAAAAQQLWSVFDEHDIDIYIFKNSSKSGLGKLREKIMGGDLLTIPATVYKYADSEAEWLKKADEKKYGTQLVTDVFMPALRRFLDLQSRHASLILSIGEILRNLNSIELLGAIEKAVEESNLQANRFLLSSTNQLLADMTGDADSPFIYEKIGSRISHLMIDEFQDTSIIQWHNFKHLLLESMSHYDAENARGTVGSMIVGDVKQSIYRWRSGDWRLLDNINKEFANEGDTEIIPLRHNFRSEAGLINFNNLFFTRAKDVLNINTAYSKLAQIARDGKDVRDGEVRFIMLSSEAYKRRHKMICDQVADLIARGVKPKDIAILGRNNDILQELAREIVKQHPEINVVSMESFQISNSTAASTIIAALRLIQRPKDRISLAILEKHSGMTAEECRRRVAAINTNQPLVDIIGEVFMAFNIEQQAADSAYISAFFDYLQDFSNKNLSTIRNFLRYWDENICTKNIETETADGVQLLTIHKSKGLEFDNVIIADGAWKTGVQRNHIWVETNESLGELAKIPFALISPSKKLEDTVFAEEYKEELVQNTIDNLNLLYVAFTRAGKNLYYYGQTSRKMAEAESNSQAEKYSSANISGLVEECLDSIKDVKAEDIAADAGGDIKIDTDFSVDYSFNSMEDEDGDDGDKLYYYVKTIGRFVQKEARKDSESQKSFNCFDLPVESIEVPLRMNKPSVTFLQSNRSKRFIDTLSQHGQASLPDNQPLNAAESLAYGRDSSGYLSIGLLLHYVLSQIKTIDDVDSVLQELETEGVIPDRRLVNLIRKRITDSRHAKEWFMPGWTVYNECSIITPEGIRRPDRVITNGSETIVIDFKFGTPKDEYREQVRTYKNLLEQMRFPNVKAYLWYVYTDTIDNEK